jgi:hypothetical protein
MPLYRSRNNKVLRNINFGLTNIHAILAVFNAIMADNIYIKFCWSWRMFIRYFFIQEFREMRESHFRRVFQNL